MHQFRWKELGRCSRGSLRSPHICFERPQEFPDTAFTGFAEGDPPQADIVTYDPTYKPSSNPSNSHPAYDHRSIVSLSCGDSGLASANSLQVTPVSVHVHPRVTGSRRFIWNWRGRNQMRPWSILARRLCKEHSSRVNVMFGLPPST